MFYLVTNRRTDARFAFFGADPWEALRQFIEREYGGKACAWAGQFACTHDNASVRISKLAMQDDPGHYIKLAEPVQLTIAPASSE